MTDAEGTLTPQPVDPAPLDAAAVVDDTTRRLDPSGGADGRRRRLAIRDPRARLASSLSGVTAIGVKELRGRMRGRRAFVVLTIYLLLLVGFAWMVELILERAYGGAVASSGAGASAQIGEGIFTALLMLETLLVLVLAPAFTAGAISLEREKQTLDLLATTPISSLAIVLGKLLSALVYVFVLIVASIPLTAIVFVFGGVAPDDVIRGYLVLVVTALGLGSVGLFFSALTKRTQAATVITYFVLLAATLGAFFVSVFWNTMTNSGGSFTNGVGPVQGRAPEALAYLNPFFAEADVLCGVGNGTGAWCQVLAAVTDRPQPGFQAVPPDQPVPALPVGKAIQGQQGALAPGTGVVDPTGVGQAVDDGRDVYWPKSAASWLVLSLVLIAASVQLVSPTRRWRGPIRRRGVRPADLPS